MIVRFYNTDINNEIRSSDGFALSFETESPPIVRLFFNSVVSESNLSEVALFSDKDKKLVYDKDYIVIMDYFNGDFLSKTVITKFIKYVCDFYKSDLSLKCDIADASKQLSDILDDLLSQFDVSCERSSEISVEDILKLFKVTLKTDFESYFEKISYYIDVLGELKLVSVLVFVNAKSFFDRTELSLLIKNCAYRGIQVLLFDSKYSNDSLPCETRYQIDEDLFIVKK